MKQPTSKRTKDFMKFEAALVMTAMKQQWRACIKLPLCFLVGLLLVTGCQTSSLVVAAKKGDITTIKALLDNGANVNEFYPTLWGWPTTALTEAAESGHMEVVRLLLDKGADVNAVTWNGSVTPLRSAVMSGHVDIANLLIDMGADINAAMNGIRIEIKRTEDLKNFPENIRTKSLNSLQAGLELLMKITTQRETVAFPEFQEKARAWRELPVKPPLSEEVRRFRVLAENAYQNKEFDKAADYYEKGLTLEPLWPEGQFNAALLYAELQKYAQAVIHMKRYLELKPDDKDTRALRDGMYVWEEKAKETKIEPPTATDDQTDGEQKPAGKRKGFF